MDQGLIARKLMNQDDCFTSGHLFMQVVSGIIVLLQGKLLSSKRHISILAEDNLPNILFVLPKVRRRRKKTRKKRMIMHAGVSATSYDKRPPGY